MRPLSSQREPSELLVGLKISDDAAVYRVAPEVAIVETLDFFPPIVDDAYASGAIAAANAMSDVYAMGGEVLFALNIVAWPEDLSFDALERLMQGAVDKIAEGDGVIAGGHTVIDTEPKFGLAVTGRAYPDRLLTKGALRPGDTLWLTKPVGTGVLTTAHKTGDLRPEDLASTVASMVALNRAASAAALEAGLHAATDITGFGLAGHAHEMAERSGVGVRIDSAAVPLLPAARTFAERGVSFGGLERNTAFYGSDGRVRFSDAVDDATRRLMLDPQTSGGLL
ncbi:MAG TPA: selenide, water dikinase SelD, partial [Candidatus Limnocylindria bacterium]|nr:selenide, water dikinase SelD [Candidatus Limnocylindria bacterium]